MKREAEILGKYILKQEINDTAIERYQMACAKLKLQSEDKILNLIQRKKWLLPYIDAGQKLSDKEHILQKKLIIMFAILETMPDYAQAFMAKAYPITYIFNIITNGISGVWKLLIGYILYKTLK